MMYTFTCYELVKLSPKIGIKIVCTLLFTYFVIQCIGRYLETETGTGDQYGPINETIFPEFSFCLKDRYKLGSTSAKNDYVYGLNGWNWNALDGSNITPGEYYRKITFTPVEVVSNIKIDINIPIMGKYSIEFDPRKEQPCGTDSILSVKPGYWYGDCVIMNVPKCLLNAHPTEIQIRFIKDVVISIQHPNQFTGTRQLMYTTLALLYRVPHKVSGLGANKKPFLIIAEI
jgi:hypothetical protein